MLYSWLVDFIVMFLIVFLVYLLFINKRKYNYSLLNENDQVKIFINRYKINIEKVNYKYLLSVIAFINSFIIAFTATIITNINSIIWSLIVCFVVLCILVYSMYEIAGRYFKNLEKKEKVVKVKKKRKNRKSEGEK